MYDDRREACAILLNNPRKHRSRAAARAADCCEGASRAGKTNIAPKHQSARVFGAGGRAANQYHDSAERERNSQGSATRTRRGVCRAGSGKYHRFANGPGRTRERIEFRHACSMPTPLRVPSLSVDPRARQKHRQHMIEGFSSCPVTQKELGSPVQGLTSANTAPSNEPCPVGLGRASMAFPFSLVSKNHGKMDSGNEEGWGGK